ncbi:hypothetical protein HHL08_14235 [Sphingobium sp. AR-3-1]|uniref:Uncharacterized protein n=1 Tax=Sphingobium psychrophilum TaxID=2728834 RepID=A0A7X9ZSQ3_9SPHN|nr:hypothetical protein [Sphingobium psychrophilum]NML11290.1 hypothetical protein [Sphingobium psychrophilum]
MTSEEINAIGTLLMKVRDASADMVIVQLGAVGPSTDCKAGNMLATVRVGQDTETAEAINLDTAIMLAKGKCDRKAESRAREKAA